MSIEQVLQENYIQEKEDGYYHLQVYADQSDSLGNSIVKGIVESEDPMMAFYEKFDFMEWESQESDWLYDTLKKSINITLEDYQAWCEKHLIIDLPYDHYLDQEICVNVRVKTGDWNYDFTLNNFYDDMANDNKHWAIDDESSLYWLCSQQGYGKREIKRAFRSKEPIENKFLASVYGECLNTTSSLNVLEFFVKMTLRDYLEGAENKRGMVIDKSTNCGLVDHWHGAGGILEIELEKDVYIPTEMLEIHVDGTNGYSVSDIYGLYDTYWQNSITYEEGARP